MNEFLVPAAQARPVAFLQADWFVFAASRSPLVDDLRGIDKKSDAGVVQSERLPLERRELIERVARDYSERLGHAQDGRGGAWLRESRRAQVIARDRAFFRSQAILGKRRDQPPGVGSVVPRIDSRSSAWDIPSRPGKPSLGSTSAFGGGGGAALLGFQ